MMANILLVEDDTSVGYMLSEYLQLKGFGVIWKTNATSALSVITHQPVDLCILDVTLPGEDGLSLATKIRKNRPELPFVFLTARSMKIDVLRGFQHGADDYIKKPVDEEELVARLEAILRRRDTRPQVSMEEIPIGALTFHPEKQQLVFDEKVIPLTKRESQLMLLLCNYQGQVLPTEHILRELWGKNDFFTRRSMDVFISRLRKKLSEDPEISIDNIHGKGYIIKIS
jgi:DNA-binding response OmpR family regulator